MSENPILWSPTREQIRNSNMYRFMQEQSCSTYDELYQWSIGDPADFWQAIAELCRGALYVAGPAGSAAIR